MAGPRAGSGHDGHLLERCPVRPAEGPIWTSRTRPDTEPCPARKPRKSWIFTDLCQSPDSAPCPFSSVGRTRGRVRIERGKVLQFLLFTQLGISDGFVRGEVDSTCWLRCGAARTQPIRAPANGFNSLPALVTRHTSAKRALGARAPPLPPSSFAKSRKLDSIPCAALSHVAPRRVQPPASRGSTAVKESQGSAGRHRPEAWLGQQ